ncbi:MAG: TVP38/TMEM64 family protein [Steroidobacteraceae bacterium]|nr:TVP38/TMEM64 family protein [Deltaproteobacteria bacterium]
MNYTKLFVFALAASAIGLFFYLDLRHFLTLEALKANHQALLLFYETHAVLMVTGFMALYILQTALSLPGATLLSLASGAIFGAATGTLYAVIAATVGAALAFLAARYLLRDFVISKFGGKLEKLNRELEQRGFNYLLFVRLVPLFPFFLINLAAGLTKLPLRTFVIATSIGIIPGGFVYVNAGASLATITSLSGVATPRVIGSLVLLGLFALAPIIYTRVRGAGGPTA